MRFVACVAFTEYAKSIKKESESKPPDRRTYVSAPAQIYILMIGMTADRVGDEFFLFCIRMASCNQIFDPWIYIMCHVPRIRRVKSKAKTMTGCKRNATFPLHTCNPWAMVLP